MSYYFFDCCDCNICLTCMWSINSQFSLKFLHVQQCIGETLKKKHSCNRLFRLIVCVLNMLLQKLTACIPWSSSTLKGSWTFADVLCLFIFLSETAVCRFMVLWYQCSPARDIFSETGFKVISSYVISHGCLTSFSLQGYSMWALTIEQETSCKTNCNWHCKKQFHLDPRCSVLFAHY